MASSPLTSLAEKLLEKAKALDAYNERNSLSPASFESESFVDPPLDIEEIRRAAIDLAQDVKRLAQGPRDLILETLNLFNDLANFHFIYHHNIPQYVPLEGAISYTELAVASSIDEVLLRRMLRVAMMNRIFIETSDCRVKHSAASRILREEPDAMDTCGFLLEEMFPSAAKMVAAMQKYPSSGEPSETAFNMAFNTSRPFYLELDVEQERSRRFGAAMVWMSRSGRFSHDHLARGFNWARFDHDQGTVVDVGGGHGAVSIYIAKATSKLRFVVQDLPITVSDGARLLPPELKERVSFMAHDFFSEQPVKGADVYFFRYILHNWSDKYARRILKALIPALKDGSTIMCCEFLPSDISATTWSDKQPYNMDMIQAIGWNSVERTSSHWKKLFESVDSRLQYLGTRTPPGCSVSFIEARFCDSLTNSSSL
ncbi:putative O-methyltransferase [Ustulina deusta]|nr:putative O-methyltransferase [Ustulina deusta]